MKAQKAKMKRIRRDRLCPALSGHGAGQLAGQGGGAKKRDRTSHHKAGPAGHSGTSPVPPCGGTAPEDVFKYCPAPWRDKLSVHYLPGPFLANRARFGQNLKVSVYR